MIPKIQCTGTPLQEPGFGQNRGFDSQMRNSRRLNEVGPPVATPAQPDPGYRTFMTFTSLGKCLFLIYTSPVLTYIATCQTASHTNILVLNS